MLYVLPADPASTTVPLSRLRARARRAGYRVLQDRGTGTYSLIDAWLNLPLLGLDRATETFVTNVLIEAALHAGLAEREAQRTIRSGMQRP